MLTGVSALKYPSLCAKNPVVSATVKHDGANPVSGHLRAVNGELSGTQICQDAPAINRG